MSGLTNPSAATNLKFDSSNNVWGLEDRLSVYVEENCIGIGFVIFIFYYLINLFGNELKWFFNAMIEGL